MNDGLQKLPDFSSMHMEHLKRTGAVRILLGTRSTIQSSVSLLLSFRLHYFLAPFELFCEKNYLKFSLQFPAGHMELPSNGHNSPISARIVTKLCVIARGKC
jgi:hypothetical protein